MATVKCGARARSPELRRRRPAGCAREGRASRRAASRSAFARAARGELRRRALQPVAEKDALAVAVIINFIDATNRVVDDDRRNDRRDRRRYGSSISVARRRSRTSTPVSTLEIVTRIGGQDMAGQARPTHSDVLVQQASTIRLGRGGRRPDHERPSDDAALCTRVDLNGDLRRERECARREQGLAAPATCSPEFEPTGALRPGPTRSRSTERPPRASPSWGNTSL